MFPTNHSNVFDWLIQIVLSVNFSGWFGGRKGWNNRLTCDQAQKVIELTAQYILQQMFVMIYYFSRRY